MRQLTAAVFWLCCVSVSLAYENRIKDAQMEYNLLSALGEAENVELGESYDGFMAFSFKQNSNIKFPSRMILPEKIMDFVIMSTLKPESTKGGYLFSVVNPMDTVVQLGVHFSPVLNDKWNVSVLYTDARKHVSMSLAKFEVPFKKQWTALAFRVLHNKVTLYLDCNETESISINRDPVELVFDSASTLYLVQAGSILKGHFEGLIETLNIYGNPDVVPLACRSPSQPNIVPSIDESIDEGSGLNEFDFGLLEDNTEIPFLDGLNEEATNDDFPQPPSDFRLKGEKGERGLRGPPGDSIRGPPGPPGPAGPKGDPGPYPPFMEMPIGGGSGGKCSCNATDILAVIKENDFFRESIRGPPGMPGKEGKTGAPGLTGPTGIPGERGAPGSKGDRGERGDPGSRGPEGLQGHKGEPGIDGIPGIPGPPGPPGSPGLPENYDESLMGNQMPNLRGSSPGPKGDSGDKGDVGRAGDRGQPGPKGERGDPGMTGAQGDRGHPGVHGQQGSKGEQGQPGFPGLAGPPGSSGLKGDRGFPGEIGPMGPPGPPGNVMYCPDSSERSNCSSSGIQIRDLSRPCQCQPGAPGIPGQRGIDGLPGLNGDTGPLGPTGLTGMPGVKGDRGDKGSKGLSGTKGDRGPPGPAMYSTEGFPPTNGTKGDKGEKGLRGRRGKTGSTGPQGPPGKPGPPGDVGYPGRPGMTGLKGEMGQKGSKGDSGGREGSKGDKGDRGRDGLPGPPGPLPSPDELMKYYNMGSRQGPPGPPGRPGLSIIGAPGEPGVAQFYSADASFMGKPGPPGPPGPPGQPGGSGSFNHHSPGPDSMKVVPGAMTFQNHESMTKMSQYTPVGTIAYIIEEEALLVRVKKGWQYILLGSLLPIATPAPPTTLAPPVPPKSDLQSVNLLNNNGPVHEPVKVKGGQLRMAALNEPYSGDTKGIRGADFDCYKQARRAGLLGTFKAFLTSRVQNLDSIVRTADNELPVVNTRGDMLFNSWKGIFNGQGGSFSQAPRIYSFSGKNILTDVTWPQKIIWHGSASNGERDLDTYCDAWQSSMSDKFGLASNLLGNKLLDQERYSCDNRFVVLCIEALTQDRRKRRRRDVHGRPDEYEFQTEEEYAKHLNEILT